MPEIIRHNEYSLGFTWMGSSDGSVGGRNHRYTPVTVYLIHSSESPMEAGIQFEAGKARTKKDAESLARAYIREHGLRDRLKRMGEGGQ